MTPADRSLTFLWWNLHNLAHFDRNLAENRRWPDSEKHYRIRLSHTADILHEICPAGLPDVMAFAEVTPTAAQALAEHLSGYQVFSPEVRGLGEFQPAMLFRSTLSAKPDIFPFRRMPRETRDMPILDVSIPGHLIRLYTGHWTARWKVRDSQLFRERAAEQLSAEVYEFLTRSGDPRHGRSRHVMILGDLNTEPFETLLQDRLHAYRDRRHARQSAHFRDQDMSRVRLYNCSWRLMGERLAHSPDGEEVETAGTYFWPDQRTWHTLDQVIVTGSLLTRTPPCLDEGSLRVVVSQAFVDADGIPRPFQITDGNPSGISDHLPIYGRIILPEPEGRT